MDRIKLDPAGRVYDADTGLTYGRVARTGDYWTGTTAPRVGQPPLSVHRLYRRDAALAVAATYVLGHED